MENTHNRRIIKKNCSRNNIQVTKASSYKWQKYLNMEKFQEIFSFSKLNKAGESRGGGLKKGMIFI